MCATEGKNVYKIFFTFSFSRHIFVIICLITQYGSYIIPGLECIHLENRGRKQYIFFGVIAFIIAVIMFFVGYLFFCSRYARTIDFSERHSKLVEVASILDNYYIGEYDADTFDDAVAAAMVDAIGDQWS